jgi:alcohol dehydrogenase, propanol-preferring
VRAFRVASAAGGMDWAETTVPSADGSHVLVEVAGAGLCHTDLSIMASPGSFASSYPFTIGHEISGRVAELGPGATGVAVGQPVLVYISWGCGRCVACRTGGYHWCAEGAPLAGFGLDGVWPTTRSCQIPAISCPCPQASMWYARRRSPPQG